MLMLRLSRRIINLWWAKRTKQRSRSRSRWRSLQLKKVNKLRIGVRVSNRLKEKEQTYMIEIPWDSIQWMRQTNCSYYIRHEHNCFYEGDSVGKTVEHLERFRLKARLIHLSDNKFCSTGFAVVIGSNIYAHRDDDGRVSGIDDHQELQYLNVQEAVRNTTRKRYFWKTIQSYPNSQTRFCPDLVALNGCLCVLEGLYDNGIDPDNPNKTIDVSFGEVYNPTTQSWESLEEPVGAGLSISRLIITPLGHGKIICECTHGDKDYIYDKTNNKWEIVPLRTFDMPIDRVCSNTVIDEASNTLYWLGQYGRFWAYDLNIMKQITGLVVGLECDPIFKGLISRRSEFSSGVSPLHLGADFFALIWTRPLLGPGREFHRSTKTHMHITFLRVVINPFLGTLFAHVVGCCRKTAPGDLKIIDAFRL